MGRPLRIEYPGAFYHVTSRGNERRAIFLNQKNYERMIGYLESATERYGAQIYCFCLMSNHYLITFKTSFTKLAFRTSFTSKDLRLLTTMRFSLRCLINAGLAPIEEVIVQSERIMQLNDVVNIFLVNDVLNVVT